MIWVIFITISLDLSRLVRVYRKVRLLSDLIQILGQETSLRIFVRPHLKHARPILILNILSDKNWLVPQFLNHTKPRVVHHLLLHHLGVLSLLLRLLEKVIQIKVLVLLRFFLLILHLVCLTKHWLNSLRVSRYLSHFGKLPLLSDRFFLFFKIFIFFMDWIILLNFVSVQIHLNWVVVKKGLWQLRHIYYLSNNNIIMMLWKLIN